MQNSEWTQLHSQLQEFMRREISTMRHLLANMHQEEVFILRKDKTYLSYLMQERTELISQLSHLRQGREHTIDTLAAPDHLSLEEVLPKNDEKSWEILTLRDQILALLDRMSLQTSRNELLTQLAHYHATLQSKAQKKAKIALATLPQEGYNKEA